MQFIKQEKILIVNKKQFEKQQYAAIRKSGIIRSFGCYHDIPQESDAKVLATCWPDLQGETRREAENFIKADGYSNIEILKEGTSPTTEYDESRVILFVNDNDIVVEEPKVG